jgi:hypothetical protein
MQHVPPKLRSRVIIQKTEIWIFTHVKMVVSYIRQEYGGKFTMKRYMYKILNRKPEGKRFRVRFRRRHRPDTKLWCTSKDRIPNIRGTHEKFGFHKRHKISWHCEWTSASEKRTLLQGVIPSIALPNTPIPCFTSVYFTPFLLSGPLPIYTSS